MVCDGWSRRGRPGGRRSSGRRSSSQWRTRWRCAPGGRPAGM